MDLLLDEACLLTPSQIVLKILLLLQDILQKLMVSMIGFILIFLTEVQNGILTHQKLAISLEFQKLMNYVKKLLKRFVQYTMQILRVY